METFLMKALQLIVALIILVTIHEFGHYLFARLFGIRVNRFYLFFNPGFSLIKYDPLKGTLRLFSRDEEHAWKTFRVSRPRTADPSRPGWRDTVYGLGWLPLGGYCDIAGMVDETTKSSDLPAEPQPWEFRTKAGWKRLLVMVGGVMFNFLLAIAIYIGIAWHWGERTVAFDQVTEGMDFTEPMHRAGFRDGDILLTLDGHKLDSRKSGQIWDLVQPGAVVEVLRDHRDTVAIQVDEQLIRQVVDANTPYMAMRQPAVIDALAPGEAAGKAGLLEGDRIVRVGNDTTPSLTEMFAVLHSDAARGKVLPVTVDRGGSLVTVPVQVSDEGRIGIQLRPASKIYPVVDIRYTFLEAVPRGWQNGVDRLTTYVSSLGMVFTKEGAKSLGGFGALGSMFPSSWDWLSFWEITAFLSVILAFMNIIPIPGLDGGHTLFLLIEMITRRKPSEKFIEVANTIGMGFLLLLLVYANFNDIYRVFIK